MPFLLKPILLFLAGLVAGVINSVAGGGTLLTFPTLIFSGLTAIGANATSTVGVLPGVMSSLWAYRRELATQTRWLWRVAVPRPHGGGGGGGAYLIRKGLVSWPEAALLAVGTIAGGFAGPHIARAVGAKAVRVFVSATGFALGIYFLTR